jgi:hypothetical protein
MADSKKLIFLALGIVVLMGVVALAYVALAHPRAVVTETLHDFGTVNEDQGFSHTFVIQNAGARPLEITRVHPECACTATAYDRLIPPGRQGTLILTVKPFSLRGQFSKKTEVFFNDPDHPKVVFTLNGVSRPLIEIQPGQVIRFRGKPGEELNGQVRLTSNLPEPWEISEYKTDIPQFIEVNLKVAEPGRSYIVEVRQKRQEPGNYRGFIKLLSKPQKLPPLILRVFGEVLPP